MIRCGAKYEQIKNNYYTDSHEAVDTKSMSSKDICYQNASLGKYSDEQNYASCTREQK